MVFSNLRKVGRTYKVNLAIEKQRDVAYKLFAFLCFVFTELLLYLVYR